MAGVGSAIARRHRLVTIAALALLAAIAWAWLSRGAGMGPHMAMDGAWDRARLAATLAMWWGMMAAMMIPAAAPMILLYDRAASRSSAALTAPSTGLFLAGYLAAWLAFSIAATSLQWAFGQAGWMDMMGMALDQRRIGGAVLVVAGAYQFSGSKGACLDHCRNPASFLARHYRRGPAGAFRLGIVHGFYCVGCCWALMALLFVVGVMNLVWVAALTLIVAAEKLLPGGAWLARVSGALLIGWGGVLVLAG